MAFKRGRGAPRARAKKTLAKSRFATKKRKFNKLHNMMQLSRKVTALTRTIETKSGVRQVSDGQEYLHNSLYTINSTFLETQNGTIDTETGIGNRIGDKITLVGGII